MAGFSAAANVLLLVAPVYMLRIYDRVLPSASHATLLALTRVALTLHGGTDTAERQASRCAT